MQMHGVYACTYTRARVYVHEGYMGSLPVCHQRDETFRCSRVNEHLKPRARDSTYFQPVPCYLFFGYKVQKYKVQSVLQILRGAENEK